MGRLADAQVSVNFASKRAHAAGRGRMERVIGYVARGDLPELLVEFLETQSTGVLGGITWIEPDKLEFAAHYLRDGESLEQRVFRYKSAAEQARLRRL